MTIKLGYWSPVFGGWLRNVHDEGMDWSFDYNLRVARAAEEAGFHTTLVAELLLNDIKGKADPTLECWSTCAALAAATKTLRIMAAVRPGYRVPALVAKEAANIDHISGGRFEVNVVSAWWKEEAERYGGAWTEHDQRYRRTSEFVQVLKGMWAEDEFHFDGEHYQIDGGILNPKPLQQNARGPGVPVYAGGESEEGKDMIATHCDAYLMHGDTPDATAARIQDMEARVDRLQAGATFSYGVAGYSLVRDSKDALREELKRITTVPPDSPHYHSYRDFVQNSHLEQDLGMADYAVSNRGLRTGLVGTPEEVAQRLGELEDAGVELVLMQMSPQLEEIRRFGEEVVPLL